MDRVIDATLSQDAETLVELVAYQQVECTTRELGEIPAPHCPPDQPDGTLVDALSSGVCKPLFVARYEVPDWVRSLLEQTDLVVYAVYRADTLDYLDADYAIVFDSAEPQEAPPGIQTVYIAEGGIVSLTSSCGSLTKLIQSLEEHGAVAILPPPEPGD